MSRNAGNNCSQVVVQILRWQLIEKLIGFSESKNIFNIVFYPRYLLMSAKIWIIIWNLGLCSKIGWIQNLLNIYLRSLLCLFVTGIKWRGEGGEDEKSWKIINRLGYSQISVLIIKYTKEQKIEGEKYKITVPTKLAQKNSLVIKINFNKAIF